MPGMPALPWDLARFYPLKAPTDIDWIRSSHVRAGTPSHAAALDPSAAVRSPHTPCANDPRRDQLPIGLARSTLQSFRLVGRRPRTSRPPAAAVATARCHERLPPDGCEHAGALERRDFRRSEE